MKQKLNQLALFAFIFLLASGLKAQNLMPAELLKIHLSHDISAITADLSNKGFEFRRTWQDVISRETISSWSFKLFSRPSETLLQKSKDTLGKETTKLVLFNSYHYKEFVSNLVKERYKFSGLQIVGQYVYYVFQFRNKTFMTIERDGDPRYFEIILSTN